jgi:hypothetical protein
MHVTRDEFTALTMVTQCGNAHQFSGIPLLNPETCEAPTISSLPSAKRPRKREPENPDFDIF